MNTGGGTIIPIALCLLCLTALAHGQIREIEYQNRAAWQIDGRKLRVTIVKSGGHLAALTLKDGAKVNPLWLPERPTIDPTDYLPARHAALYGSGPGARLASGLLGHNLCFPFWGNPSESEFKAGFSTHGETGIVSWTKDSEAYEAGALTLTVKADLPASGARISRALTLDTASPVLYVVERAENLGKFDRPVGWCEHVTIGAPFLKNEVTVFDASLTRGRDSGDLSGAEFAWPQGMAERQIDLRKMRDLERTRVLNNFLVDERREFGYFTAVNPEMNLMIGYLWSRSDFPWVNVWETSMPADGNAPAILARGFEFGNTPVQGSIKAWIKAPALFGVPTFDWLDAGSALVKRYCAFMTAVPPAFVGVETIQVEADRLEIIEREKRRRVVLPFRRVWLK